MADGHLHEPAPGDSPVVFIVSVVPWPWLLPFGSSLLTAPWPFFSAVSPAVASLWRPTLMFLLVAEWLSFLTRVLSDSPVVLVSASVASLWFLGPEISPLVSPWLWPFLLGFS